MVLISILIALFLLTPTSNLKNIMILIIILILILILIVYGFAINNDAIWEGEGIF